MTARRRVAVVAAAAVALVVPLSVHTPGVVAYDETLAPNSCHLRAGGQLPDPACTPGAADPALTRAVLCDPAFRTDSVRPSVYQTNKVKAVVMAAYGLADRTPADFELDHLVPLNLGGSSSVSNLWPEFGRLPNAKDLGPERDLKPRVCAGELDLAVAQRAVAHDWRSTP